MTTAVILGGNSGMGKATAIALASVGYRVIIHGKNPEKTKIAAEEIRSRSGNGNVEFIAADISVLKGMKELAVAIRAKTTEIHAFVLSTGVILPRHVITADGMEAGFAIQYLSRFTLTELLKQELKNGKAHIVHVGAPVMKNAQIFFDDLALKNNFSMMRALGQEMFANHLFVQEYARRNPSNETVMNILHVGIARTDILRNTNFFLRIMGNLIGKSPEAAASNIVYLASDPAVAFSGYFLPKPGRPNEKQKIGYDSSMAERLWNTSMELIKAI
ncbi:MAG TPA: SDR family NAD(P)-dependent oxidoreductase [Bacteroidia bacterium]|jgi:NAD(P)-dependent dehydrogenase (short-subunit alcohol dehydrogenase family)|nr:SDR family NAD(P)-dependent oxidoreductase [Bacteroidia bacterium]